MEENLHKDNLSSFFKKEFDKLPDTSEGDAWDMPSDDVWMGIETGLPVPAKTIFTTRNISVTLLLLTGFAGILFLFYKNKQLSDNLHLQKIEIAALNDSLENEKIKYKNEACQDNEIKRTGIIEREETKRIATVNNNENKQAVNILKKGSTYNSGKKEKIFQKETLIVENENINIIKKEALPSISNQDNTPFVNIEKQEGLLVEKVINTLQSTHPLPLPFAVKYKEKEVNLAQLAAIKSAESTARKKLQFFAGAYISPNFNANAITASGGGHPLFRKFEKSEWSNEKGLKLGMKIGKHWKISTGIASYATKLTTRQTFKVAYENPTAVGDDVQTTYGLKIESSYGTSDVDVDLRHNNMQNFTLGENLLLDVNSKQMLQFINIPLLIGYEMSKGRFSFELQAGVALNILKQSTFEVEIRPHHPRLRRHQPARVRKKFDVSNKTGLDYIVSVGAAYALTPSIRLSLEPTFRKNIKPIQDTADFSNKLYAFGVHTGLYYYF